MRDVFKPAIQDIDAAEAERYKLKFEQ